MIPLTKELAQQVKSRRTELNLTQQELADRVGVKRNVIANVEGRRVKSITDDLYYRLNIALSRKVKKRTKGSEKVSSIPALGMITQSYGGVPDSEYEMLGGLDMPEIKSVKDWLKKRGIDAFDDMTTESLDDDVVMVFEFMTPEQKRKYLRVLYVLMTTDNLYKE